jgi:hypothetical protein
MHHAHDLDALFGQAIKHEIIADRQCSHFGTDVGFSAPDSGPGCGQ